MRKLRDVFDLSPPEMSFCVVLILFAILMSSIFSYCTICFIDEYASVKDTLENGELVEAEFKEVGKQYATHSNGRSGVDGYHYFAIYCYYDDDNNYYETHSAPDFYSPEEVIKYADKNPTKTIYIDGKGTCVRSGDESLTEYTIRGIGVMIVTVLFYVITVIGIIQLVRRIKMKKAEKAQKKEIT